MAARTLKLANSAFYGVAGRVATIRDAVHLLGRRTLASLLTTAAVSAQFGPTPVNPHFTFARFWRHALGTALAAQAIARELGHDEELAFTAGLLHDIGQLALATHFPVEFGAVGAAAAAADLPSRPAELAVLGLDHAAVGTLIAQHWRFPGHVAQAIAQHHTPQPDAAHPRSASLADVVHVADAIAHALNLSGADDEAVPDVDMPAWTRLGLSPSTCLRLFERTETGVASLCQALGV
jgi:putative nucleotidyltransferase with HDIG domain